MKGQDMETMGFIALNGGRDQGELIRESPTVAESNTLRYAGVRLARACGESLHSMRNFS